MWWIKNSISVPLQGRSACGVTPSLRTVATQWWSSSSEPSCTPRMANSSTSYAPESQVRWVTYAHSASPDQKWMHTAIWWKDEMRNILSTFSSYMIDAVVFMHVCVCVCMCTSVKIRLLHVFAPRDQKQCLHLLIYMLHINQLRSRCITSFT